MYQYIFTFKHAAHAGGGGGLQSVLSESWRHSYFSIHVKVSSDENKYIGPKSSEICV